MNQSVATYEKRASGYVGLFRIPWKAYQFEVRTKKDGPVLYFETAEKAELAAWRVKHKIEEPHYRRCGERLSGGRSEAEKLFPGLKRRAVA